MGLSITPVPIDTDGTFAANSDDVVPSQKAAKTYVDTALSSFDVKPDVAYASTTALPSNTYSNGSSGVGATLIGTANGPLIIDSVTLVVGAVGQRILVAGESSSQNNGWYTVTQVGVVAVSKYILTRATESDQATEIGPGYLTGVVAPNTLTPGSSNNGKVFISVAADPFVVGTTALTFSQVGSTYSAGNGLTLSGSTFSINTAITADLTTVQSATNKTFVTPDFTNGFTIQTLAASGKIPIGNGTDYIASVPAYPNASSNIGKLIQSDGANFITSTMAYPTGSAPVSGKILVSDGTNIVASTPTFPNASASSGKVIRSDGTNWVASTPTFPTTAGVAGKVLYTDGTNYLESVPTLPVSASAIAGKIIRSDGTNWIASTQTIPTTAGTNGNLWVSDGTNMVSAPRTMDQAAGSSSSGTNGTVIARIVAGAGNQLVNFMAFIGQANAANTNVTLNVNYADGTATNISSVYATAGQIFLNYGGVTVSSQAQLSSATALSAKKVVGINVFTMGAGGGIRGAVISAEEIPMS